MQGQNLPNICNSVIRFFGTTATELGKTVKFVKRESKLTSAAFAESLIIGCLSDRNISLESMRQLLKKRDVKITTQGLHQRFNKEATALIKALFYEGIQQFKSEKSAVIDL